MRRLLEMVTQDRMDLSGLVTHDFTLAQLPEAFDAIQPPGAWRREGRHLPGRASPRGDSPITRPPWASEGGSMSGAQCPRSLECSGGGLPESVP